MATALVTIEGRRYAPLELEPFLAHGRDWFPPEGACFFCPQCARIWAEIRLPAGSRHNVYSTPCKDHHVSFFNLGGSLWLPLHDEINGAFGPDILCREVLLHLDALDLEPSLQVYPEPCDEYQGDLRASPQGS